MTNKKTDQLRSLTRWLLSATLMLGIFSFVNYTGPSSTEQIINPIELVSDSKPEISKRTITFKSADTQSNGSNIRNFSKSWELYSLRAYNQLEKLKFKDCFNQIRTVLFTNLLYQLTRIQQNSKEYPSSIALG